MGSGAFASHLGGGYRFSLTNDVGLDLGPHYHSVGEPWNWYDKYRVGKAGLDVGI